MWNRKKKAKDNQQSHISLENREKKAIVKAFVPQLTKAINLLIKTARNLRNFLPTQKRNPLRGMANTKDFFYGLLNWLSLPHYWPKKSLPLRVKLHWPKVNSSSSSTTCNKTIKVNFTRIPFPVSSILWSSRRENIQHCCRIEEGSEIENEKL